MSYLNVFTHNVTKTINYTLENKQHKNVEFCDWPTATVRFVYLLRILIFKKHL